MATRSPQQPRKPRPWRWTRAHLARLPDDGQRYEVLDGALLVTPRARFAHQEVAARLLGVIRPFCERQGLGVAVGPGAVVWDDNELQPDVQVIPIVGDRTLQETWETLPLPLLVIEVLLPGSARHDRGVKRAAYLRLGIPEYWAVDIEVRSVSVFRSDAAEPVVAAGTLEWRPRGDAPPLVIDVAALLAL